MKNSIFKIQQYEKTESDKTAVRCCYISSIWEESLPMLSNPEQDAKKKTRIFMHCCLF